MKKLIRKLALGCLAFLLVLPASAAVHYHMDPEFVGEPEPAPTVSPWAQAEVARTQALGFVPDYSLPDDYSRPITREQFMNVAMEFVALQQHYDETYELNNIIAYYLAEEDPGSNYWYGGKAIKLAFTDCVDATIPHAIGLVEGRGGGIFDPDGLITRQEAAVMLTRAYTVYGGTLPESAGTAAYPDASSIADWAKESASALNLWGVMQGKEDGAFDPDGHYSVEQCLVTFLRLYETAPTSRKSANTTPLFTYEQIMDYRMSFDPNVTFSLEGPAATFLRIDTHGTSRGSVTTLYFIYRDGGMSRADLGICNSYLGITPRLELEDCAFSEDGKTFSCTATLSEETVSSLPAYHDLGTYRISIDIETGIASHEFEAPPQ